MLSLQNTGYYAGHIPLLENVSFTAAPGEIVVVVGSNGAGKSTLLKIASGTLKAAKGTVSIQQKKFHDWQPGQLAQFLAVLHQQTILTLPFKVKDVVMMGRYPHFKSRPAAIDDTIVAHAIRKAGIEALAERNYLDLSGGEQQRVHLARVFAQIWVAGHYKTRYLFMDEPSNNLDIRHQHSMLTMARAFAAEGNCVVTVLHDLNLAMQYADKVLLLKKGKQVAFGTPAEVMSEVHISHAYDFPVHIINHAAYGFPIVMPAVNTDIIIP